LSWVYRGNPAVGSKFVDIAEGSGITAGYIYLLRNDGKVYFTDRNFSGWNQYDYGLPEIPTKTSYIGITLGLGNTAGYIYILRNDGKVYYTNFKLNEWNQNNNYQLNTFSNKSFEMIKINISIATSEYIYKKCVNNSININHTWNSNGNFCSDNSWISIVASNDYLYTLRNDGIIMRLSNNEGNWSSWSINSTDKKWISITTDGKGYLYAINNHGEVVYTTESSNNWKSKGSVGNDISWVDILADGKNGYVYVIGNNRKIVRAPTGNSNTWSNWINGTDDTTFVASAIKGNNLFVLRNDGIIYKLDSENNWAYSFNNYNSDNKWNDSGISIPETEYLLLLICLMIFIENGFHQRKKKSK
jgi:hypothetical protein